MAVLCHIKVDTFPQIGSCRRVVVCAIAAAAVSLVRQYPDFTYNHFSLTYRDSIHPNELPEESRRLGSKCLSCVLAATT